MVQVYTNKKVCCNCTNWDGDIQLVKVGAQMMTQCAQSSVPCAIRHGYTYAQNTGCNEFEPIR